MRRDLQALYAEARGAAETNGCIARIMLGVDKKTRHVAEC